MSEQPDVLFDEAGRAEAGPVTEEIRAAIVAWAEASPLTWSARAILPSGRIAVVRDGFRAHREARREVLRRETELRARYGIKLYTSCARAI